MITREQFDRIDNCQESLDYVALQPSLAAAWDNCDRADWLLAFARKARIAIKAEFARVAIGEAEAVLHIWAKKYPNDDRPQKAIKAAKDCLGNKTSALRASAYTAADAAHAAAHAAAYAAAAADAAAYAAYAAAADTAYAASAAADASYASYAAGIAADDKDAFRRAQCDRIRAIIPNPFIN